MVFLELQCNVCCFSRVTTGNSGNLSCSPMEIQSPFDCEGDHSIALESRHGNQASRRVEGGISRSFSNCGRKPWIPSTCDSDLRELLMVPMGSQEYCVVARGLWGLHWSLCNGRGPHLELRRYPQVSSPVLTWVSVCVCRFKQGVRSRLVWMHGSLLLSWVVKGVSGLQLS